MIHGKSRVRNVNAISNVHLLDPIEPPCVNYIKWKRLSADTSMFDSIVIGFGDKRRITNDRRADLKPLMFYNSVARARSVQLHSPVANYILQTLCPPRETLDNTPSPVGSDNIFACVRTSRVDTLSYTRLLSYSSKGKLEIFSGSVMRERRPPPLPVGCNSRVARFPRARSKRR